MGRPIAIASPQPYIFFFFSTLQFVPPRNTEQVAAREQVHNTPTPPRHAQPRGIGSPSATIIDERVRWVTRRWRKTRVRGRKYLQRLERNWRGRGKGGDPKRIHLREKNLPRGLRGSRSAPLALSVALGIGREKPLTTVYTESLGFGFRFLTGSRSFPRESRQISGFSNGFLALGEITAHWNGWNGIFRT